MRLRPRSPRCRGVPVQNIDVSFHFNILASRAQKQLIAEFDAFSTEVRGQFRGIDVEPGHNLGVHRGLFNEMCEVVCKVFKADAATWNAGRRAKQPASATRTLTYLVQLLRDAAYSKLSLHHKVYQLEQLLLIELHRLDVTARGTADRANDFAGFANARTLTIRVESTAASASRPPPHRILR